MKLNVPLLVGAAVVAAGLAALVLWQPEPKPEETAAASLDRVRAELREKGGVEGRDFILDPPVFLKRGDDEMIVRIDIRFPNREPGREFHRLLRGDKGWEVDRNIWRSFIDFAKAEEKAARDRCAKRLQERYQDAVNIPGENVRVGTRMMEIPVTGTPEVRLAGYIDIAYVDRGAEGMYVEEFTFEKGAWKMEGTTGRLFDKGPRPGSGRSP